MRVIDPETWPRRSHYAFFRGLPDPHLSLTAEVRATRLMTVVKPAGGSTFNAALWAIMVAANGVPELRTRFRGDQVVEHDVVHASVTVPIEDGRFAFCSVRYSRDWPVFDRRCRAAIEAGRRQTALVENIEGHDEWIFLTCLPWLSFTAMTHPTGGPEDCIPRIAWGRFFERAGDWWMPVGVQVHHALVDGVHLGAFYEALETTLAAVDG